MVIFSFPSRSSQKHLTRQHNIAVDTCKTWMWHETSNCSIYMRQNLPMSKWEHHRNACVPDPRGTPMEGGVITLMPSLTTTSAEIDHTGRRPIYERKAIPLTYAADHDFRGMGNGPCPRGHTAGHLHHLRAAKPPVSHARYQHQPPPSRGIATTMSAVVPLCWLTAGATTGSGCPRRRLFHGRQPMPTPSLRVPLGPGRP
jgi:hypothetical protein